MSRSSSAAPSAWKTDDRAREGVNDFYLFIYLFVCVCVCLTLPSETQTSWFCCCWIISFRAPNQPSFMLFKLIVAGFTEKRGEEREKQHLSNHQLFNQTLNTLEYVCVKQWLNLSCVERFLGHFFFFKSPADAPTPWSHLVP